MWYSEEEFKEKHDEEHDKNTSENNSATSINEDDVRCWNTKNKYKNREGFAEGQNGKVEYDREKL